MDINKNLSFLHNELQNLYSSLRTEKKALEDNKKSKELITSRLKEIKQYQNSNKRITFLFMDKKLTISKSLVLDSEYDSILKTMILSSVSNEIDLTNKKSEYFEIVLMIFQLKNDFAHNVIPIKMQKNYRKIEIENKSFTRTEFEKELDFYFSEETQKQIFDFFIIKINNSIVSPSNLRNKSFYISKFEIEGENREISVDLQNYQINDIKDIIINEYDVISKALFVNLNNTLIMELSEPIIINEIYLKPFWGDLDHFYPGDGSDLLVEISVNKIAWFPFGLIPSNYGNDIDDKYKVIKKERNQNSFPNCFAKYIRIRVNRYMLSIAYIEII